MKILNLADYNDNYRDKGPKLYIEPWVLAEDVGWFEDE